MGKRIVGVAICIAAAAAAWAAWPCAAEDTTVRKIETAEKAGLLSADEALMYKFMGLFAAYKKFDKPTSKLDSLIDETDQLISIFVVSIKTAKENKEKTS